MNNDKIHVLASSKKDIIFNENVDKSHSLIIDFYNIYCNMIKFSKYKTFSKETFIICFNNLLLNKLKNYDNVYFVSKPIFEIDTDYIYNTLSSYKNITYIIVNDTHLIKSKNKERDDYVCILLQYFHLKNNIKSIIISNDTFRNHVSLSRSIKPFSIDIYKCNFKNTIQYDTTILENYTNIIKFPIIRSGFKFRS